MPTAKPSSLRYAVFDQLRFPLIILVVYIHSIVYPVDYQSIDFSSLTWDNICDLSRMMIGNIIAQVAVPIFFFISGYLFFHQLQKWNWLIYINKIKKRIRSIFVPFIIWNTLAIILACVIISYREGHDGIVLFLRDNNYIDLYWSCNMTGAERTNELGIPTYSTFPYLIQLWYLRDLMVLFVISPFIYYLLKIFGLGGVFLLLLCYLLNIGISFPGFSSASIFYFSTGAFFRIYDMDPIKKMWKLRTLFLILALIMFVVELCFFNPRSILYNATILIGTIATLNFATITCLKRRTIPDVLVKMVFFIYLSHNLYINSITKYVLEHMIDIDSPLQILMGYIISPYVTVGLCILLFICMKKMIPHTLEIFSGGRV